MRAFARFDVAASFAAWAISVKFCTPAPHRETVCAGTFIHSFLQQTLERSTLCVTDDIMEKGSISGSLDRIEAAIERIEAAAHKRAMAVQMASDPAADAAISAELEQRHVALKIAVEHALGRLDTVIAGQS